MRHTNFHRTLLATGLLMAMAVSAFSTSQTLTFPPGGQLTLPVSNTNPNRVEVPGDRVVALHSAAGKLTDKRNTPTGAVLFSSDSVHPFTLFIETEHGQTFSLRAMPRHGEGRSYRLLGSQPVARPAARAWETAQPYESLLTALNRAALNRRLPDSYAPAPVGTDRPGGSDADCRRGLGGTTLDISQVQRKMTNISKIFGDPSIGVSIMTDAVKTALAVAKTQGSRVVFWQMKLLLIETNLLICNIM